MITFGRCIPRLHLGMKFASIKLLDPIHIEKTWRIYKIEDGLIVQEVYSSSLLFSIARTVPHMHIME
jgi:hypothetical protein